MPTAALSEIADELAAVIDAASIPNLEQVRGRRVFSPTPPSIDIYPADPFRRPDEAGFGDLNGAYLWTVRARVNPTDDEAWQDILLDLMDDDSANCVAAILEADQTLNGLAGEVVVDGPTGHRIYVEPSGEAALVGVEWTVAVLRAES